jgi:hypothetical protein
MSEENMDYRQEARKFAPEDAIKQAYMMCSNKEKDGIYTDEVDLREFGELLVWRVGRDIAKAERMECIKFVENLNKDVAQALRDRREHL